MMQPKQMGCLKRKTQIGRKEKYRIMILNSNQQLKLTNLKKQITASLTPLHVKTAKQKLQLYYCEFFALPFKKKKKLLSALLSKVHASLSLKKLNMQAQRNSPPNFGLDIFPPKALSIINQSPRFIIQLTTNEHNTSDHKSLPTSQCRKR